MRRRQRQETSPTSLSVRLGRAFRRYFITGLATLLPVVVTLYLLVTIFRLTDGLLGRHLGVAIPGLGLVVTVLIILAVGVISIHFFGRQLFRVVEAWFIRLPLVKKIYPAAKQFSDFLFAESGQRSGIRQVVLVEYPRLGTYSVAFVTNEAKTVVTGRSQTLLTLLIPNPPSPFTGPIIFVPQEDVVPLDLSVEDAVKLIVSGGVVAAPFQAARRTPHHSE